MSLMFIDLAYEVLKQSSIPLTYQQIWQKGVELGLNTQLNTIGKTPAQTLGAMLFVDTRDNPGSKFIKVSKRPARFFLNERKNEISDTLINNIEKEDLKDTKIKSKFTERDLHPLLSYFVYTNPGFNKGKGIYTKTVYHEKSTKKGLNEWLHPDVVGFYIPFGDWETDLIELNKISDQSSLKLYSFEIKKNIDKSNYRESFFQTVSNSSWANEGYLVAAGIKEDDELYAELERLSLSFGIGIIELDLEDIDSSKIIFPPKIKETLDWETMNKLCEQNIDFKKFIQDIKIDFDSKKVHKSEFDSIPNDIVEYIKNILH